jgi:hypothetical protein
MLHGVIAWKKLAFHLWHDGESSIASLQSQQDHRILLLVVEAILFLVALSVDQNI